MTIDDIPPEATGSAGACTVAPLTDQLVGLQLGRGDDKKLFLAGQQKVTYGDLRDNVSRTLALFAHFDVGRGARVVIASERDEVVSYLYGACLLGGQIAVVLDPQSSAAEITVIASKARPDIAFVDQAVLDRSESLRTDDVTIVAVGTPVETTGFGLRLRRRAGTQTDTYPGCLAALDAAASIDPSATRGPAIGRI